MGNKVVDKIIEDAKASAQELLDKAQKKAEEILAQAKEEQKALRKAIRAQAKEAGEMEFERLLSAERINSKKDILAKKREILDNLFSEVMEELLSDKKTYKRWLVDVIAASGVKEGEIIPAKGDKVITKAFVDSVNKKAKSVLKLSNTKGNFRGGVVIRSGTMEVNATLELALEIAREELEPEIAKMLWKEG